MKFVSLFALIGAVVAGGPSNVIVDDGTHYMSHAVLRIKPGEYPDLNKDLVEFLESEIETDKKLIAHVSIQEVEGNGNPSLVFIGEDGEDKETLFAQYVPVSMVKDLIRDKKWVADKPKAKEEEL